MYYRPKVSGQTTGTVTGRPRWMQAGRVFEAPAGEFAHVNPGEIEQSETGEFPALDAPPTAGDSTPIVLTTEGHTWLQDGEDRPQKPKPKRTRTKR